MHNPIPLPGGREERFGDLGLRSVINIYLMRNNTTHYENEMRLYNVRSAFLRSIWNLQRKGYAPGDDFDVFALWNDAAPRIIERIGWKSDV